MDVFSQKPEYSYDNHGANYTVWRREDPFIAAQIHPCLGEAKTVLNVGAGSGNYEPIDRITLAVEPSVAMREQRPRSRVPAIRSHAEQLPFDDNAFDASMTVLSVHHWPNPDLGLKEMRRVTQGPLVVVSYDPAQLRSYWLFDYLPYLAEVEARRFPSIDFLQSHVGTRSEVHVLKVGNGCIDGFNEAFYNRPEAFLDANVRRSQSAWAWVSEAEQAEFFKKLEADLTSGEWDRKYGHLRSEQVYHGAIRIVVGFKD